MGIGFLLASIEAGGPVCIEASTGLLVSFSILLGSLVFTAIAVPLSGFTGSKRYAVALIVIYLAFLVANLTIEFTGA